MLNSCSSFIRTEGKGIHMEQYRINNGVIAPLKEGTAFGKHETDQ